VSHLLPLEPAPQVYRSRKILKPLVGIYAHAFFPKVA